MTSSDLTSTNKPQAISLEGLATDQLVGWLQTMVLIRRFEEKADEMALRGKIPGGVHVSVGQEAVAVGSVSALDPGDILAGGHRSHHHALAKGLSPTGIMAELFGKASGVSGGRGGSMHLADFPGGYFGGNGIVGAGLGIAMGAALGAKIRDVDQVAVGFIGDGGANSGRVWEFVNLATVWQLPLIVVCENNLYAVETLTDAVTGGESIAARAAGFGLPAEQVDGQDVCAVHRAVRTARNRAAAGDGPTFLEAMTYRYHGHNAGEIIRYRTQEETDHWRSSKDPIERLAQSLRATGLLADGQFEQIESDVDDTIASAVETANADPFPDAGSAALGVSDWMNSESRGYGRR